MKENTIITNDVGINIKVSRIFFDFFGERDFFFDIIVLSKFVVDVDFLKNIDIKNNNRQIFFVVYKNFFIIERSDV